MNKNEIEITYEINSGIPFKWEYEIKNKKIVEFVKEYVTNDYKDEIIDGAPINITYVFRGLKKGKTTIIFKCVNFGDNYISQEEKYTIKVDNNKNIEIIDKKNIL